MPLGIVIFGLIQPLGIVIYYCQSFKKRMEIDFLVANAEMRRTKNVTAVEVKSEKDYSTTSLDKFHAKFRTNVGNGIILHPGDLSLTKDVSRFPLYMAPWIDWRCTHE